MAHPQAARRYAKALYALAGEQGAIADVRADLAALARLLADAADLRAFLANQVIPSAQRVQALSELFERGPGRVAPLLFRFLLFLEEKKRLVLLPEIAAAFEALDDDRSGVLRVTITSPHPLTPAQLEALSGRLKDRLGRREIVASQRIDPALLGGFTVQVGDTVYDYSLETQLQTLKQKLAFA